MMEVIVSAAMSIDGCLDDASAQRLKLSSDEDCAAVEVLRAQCDAILVGAGTVRCDDPSLVVRRAELRAQRLAEGRDADITKVTVSRDGDLPAESRFFTDGGGRKIVFTNALEGSPRVRDLSRHAEVVCVSEAITARRIVSELEQRGVRRLLVEGGSQILTMFFEEGAVDRFRLAVAPFFVGDQRAPKLVGAGRFAWGKHSPMRLKRVEMLGNTTVMHMVAPESIDAVYMREAIAESRKCVPSQGAYSVGAVVVTCRGEVFRGYTHETDPKNHAEEEAVAKALVAGADLRGATIYCSMEPCSTRKSKPKSCSQLIMEHGFARVVYALAEPALFVVCNGTEMLRSAGIEVEVMEQFADEVRKVNSHLVLTSTPVATATPVVSTTANE